MNKQPLRYLPYEETETTKERRHLQLEHQMERDHFRHELMMQND